MEQRTDSKKELLKKVIDNRKELPKKEKKDLLKEMVDIGIRPVPAHLPLMYIK